MRPWMVAALSLLVMEPIVTVVHRRTMHGWAWGWHRSHHLPPRDALEANDLFPLVFAGITVAAMALGAAVASLRPVLWIGSGVTAYGLAYLVVHDLYIHERLGPLPGGEACYIRWVARAHGIHHRFGRQPYGFLLPLVPADLRARSRGPVGGAVLARSPRSAARWAAADAVARPAAVSPRRPPGSHRRRSSR